MMIFFAFLACGALALPPSSSPPCSLNGILSGATCKCDPGWKGATCGQLDLCPVPSDMPGFWNDSLSSWGASPLFNPDKTPANSTIGGAASLFVSVMAGGCPLSSWEHNSYIARIDGPSFDGRLALSTVEPAVTGPEAHNPEALLHDGNISLFVYNGCTNRGYKRCHNGTNVDPVFPATPSCNGNTNMRRFTRRVTAPAKGGWEALLPINFQLSDPSAPTPEWWCSLSNSNPSPLLLDDGDGGDGGDGGGGAGGGVLMAVTSHCPKRPGLLYPPEYVLVGRATTIAGPFIVDVEAGPVFGNGSQPHNEAEDPFLFRDRRGGFHLLAHGMNIYSIRSGRHAWSLDGLHWETDPGPDGQAYGAVVHHTDSAVPTVLARRERPKLLLGKDGKPTHLINGVQRLQDFAASGMSHTLVQPVC